MGVLIGFALLSVLLVANGERQENDPPSVTPEFLDQLLREKRYEEFSYYMALPSPELAKLNEVNPMLDPRFNKDLLEGDMILKPSQSEEQRQGIDFRRNPGSRWPNVAGQPSYVPYSISPSFSPGDREKIDNGIKDWNAKAQCVKFRQRTSEGDYVNIFAGNGCYAHIGRIGGQQSLSLGRGCVRHGIILHEMEHSIGISHEHNRNDRDQFVRVQWQNIPPWWHSQYRRNNPRRFGLQGQYDYYSIMHYPMRAPMTGLDAFRILKSGIDRTKLGNRQGFTDTDMEKIRILYCESATT